MEWFSADIFFQELDQTPKKIITQTSKIIDDKMKTFRRYKRLEKAIEFEGSGMELDRFRLGFRLKGLEAMAVHWSEARNRNIAGLRPGKGSASGGGICWSERSTAAAQLAYGLEIILKGAHSTEHLFFGQQL